MNDIPTQWAVDRLKFSFSRVQRPYSADVETVTAFRDGEVTLRSNRRTDGFTEADKYIGYQGILPGDLAIHAMDGFAGAIGVSDSSGKCSPVVTVCEPKPGINPHYFAHVIRRIALGGYLTALAKGIRERSTDFRWVDAGNLLVPVPMLDEQDAIVNFLDRETGKIDALIDKQHQLIATLREDRTATITHAVTKGLNPDADMKESGVEWIGEIPAHWTPCRVKNLILTIDSGTSVNGSSAPAGEGEVGVLKTSSVSTGELIIRQNKTVLDEDLARVTCSVQADTLIVNRANTPSLVGAAGYSSDSVEWLYLSDKLWQVRLVDNLAQFVHYWTHTPVYRSQISAQCVGASSSMQNLSITDFKNMSIGIPSQMEAGQIVSFLTREVSRIDDLIRAATKVVEALREYRSSLITAAVTGKIDVREAV